MAIETIDLTNSLPPTPVKTTKRKRGYAARDEVAVQAGPSKTVDLTKDFDGDAGLSRPKKKRSKESEDPPTEKRLKR
jgi:hypothetical protein